MIHPVIITAVLNGWSIQVGCQTVVFTDLGTMLKELEQYFRAPCDTVRRYSENAQNKCLLDVPAAPRPVNPDAQCEAGEAPRHTGLRR